MLQYITWNPDPELFRIGSIAVRWYGLLFATAFIIGYFIIQHIFKYEKLPPKLLFPPILANSPLNFIIFLMPHPRSCGLKGESQYIDGICGSFDIQIIS